MKRNELTQAVQTASGESGYAFHSGPANLINGEVGIYPALWLEPPILSSAQGRTEGDITYRVTAHLMALPDADGERDNLWAKLEKDALEIARKLASDSHIRDVANVACTPALRSLTLNGEVSVTLSCETTIWYSI